MTNENEINFSDILNNKDILDAFDQNAISEPVEYDKFGQLKIQALNFKKWETTLEGKRVGIDISLKEWQSLPKRGKSFEYKFIVDVEEFDEKARDNSWGYDRRVQFEGTDWFKVFTPSVELIFGEKALLEEECSKTLAKINMKYIWAKDVPQSPNKTTGQVSVSKTTGKPFMTIKIIKIFDSREECQTAYSERYGGSVSNDDRQSIPENVVIPTLPLAWVKYPSELQTEYLRYISEGKTIQQTAIILNIIDDQGNPGLGVNNQKIDANKVLQWLAKVPF